MRDESQWNAEASWDKDRAAEDCRHLARQREAANPPAARGPRLGLSEADGAENPITPGWDQRPGANLPHVDQLACGRISNMRMVAPASATLALCVLVTIIIAF